VAAHRLGTTTSSISSVPAAPPGADVLVCDALALAYRPSSCDAALCIAVLHHISSRQRRVELLAQLGAVLRPGGRGLVTVWATLQEDPAKTIQRWHKIQEGSSSSQGGQQQQQEGPDFLVPWHLPFHRAGGLQLQQQQAVGAGSAGGDGSSQSSMAPARPAAAGTPGGGMRLDAAKGAVVLQRYYHLFEQGELEGLVREVPGLQVLDSFYDRSNWCVVFGRSTSEGAGSAEGCV
jgi:alkylated DNA repair protein alkB family protein 8